MAENPFSPPTAPLGYSQDDATIQFRVFRSKSFAFSFSTESLRRDLRRKVQQAVDQEIGAGHVISIQEYTEQFGVVAIVVWYRVGRS